MAKLASALMATERARLLRAKGGIARRAMSFCYSDRVLGEVGSVAEHLTAVGVAGWASPEGGLLDSVMVTVDGAPVARALLHHVPLHPDRVSWDSNLDWSLLPKGRRQIGAILLRADGLWSRISSVAFESRGHVAPGVVDSPGPGSTVDWPVLTVSGWLLTGQGFDEIDVRLDDRSLGRARLLSQPRPDVAAVFGDPEAPISGWDFISFLPEESLGRRALTVTARGSQGAYQMFTGEVLIQQTDARRPEDPGRIDVLRRRTSALAVEPTEAGINLLVVTHHLGLGGGQLYLQLLLHDLAGRENVTCQVLSSVDGVLRDELEEMGIPVHIVGGTPATGLAYEEWLHQLAAVASRSGANVVLANTAGCFWGVDLASRLRIPAAWAIHESFEPEHFLRAAFGQEPDPVVKSHFYSALSAAGAVVFESEATMEIFADHIRQARAIRIDYGIDLNAVRALIESTDRRAVRARLGFGETDVMLLCLGTFEPRKAQGMLAAAFARVAKKHPDAVLALVGDSKSPYSDAVHDEVRRLGLADRILLVPMTPDTSDWYIAADGFVLASEIESLPRSMIEAMAYGNPVLGAAVFGVPDIVKDGETGLLFQPGSIGEVAGAIDRFCSLSPRSREQMGMAARDLVLATRSAGHYSQEYWVLLRELVASKGLAVPSVGHVRGQ